MGKLVVLKLGEGSFERGFPATLQIGEDGARPSTEVIGKLPPHPELLQYYHQWQLAYQGLGLRSRLSAPDQPITHVSIREDCEQAAQPLRDRFNLWLKAPSFREIREKWLEKLAPSDTIRVILQCEDFLLQKLPWHLWDLMERYPDAEIALSAPAYEQVTRPEIATEKVSVLAILGNSKGIDTQADRVLLEQLPTAEVRLLVEPSRQEVSDRLWEQPWDILFFAGHSSSQKNGETGRIYINQTDSLTISELKFALRKAVAAGLQLAIFNSCDGLGLARKLADLHIPQVIVMREPVPDQVAQAFLKYFLDAFARGQPLYQSVRQARERLQGLENQFPCATWLPVIYQNPAEMPPTWDGLRGKTEGGDAETQGRGDAETQDSKFKIQNSKLKFRRRLRNFAWTVGASMVATVILAGTRYLGLLQPYELKAFDQLMRLRPVEWTDSRLVVVTIDEEDIQRQKKTQSSISDATLNRLLVQLERFQPRAIGLDMYRDFAVDPNQKALATQLKQNSKLIVVCKVNAPDSGIAGIKPPPEVPVDRLGFSDFADDDDGILRRQLLYMDLSANSPCATRFAFATQLVSQYLAAEGIFPTFTANGDLQFGNTILKLLQSHTSGYQGINAWGGQMLLNYRSNPQPIELLSLKQVLNGQVNPDAVKNRIILIGVTAKSSGDHWSTPYGTALNEKMPGVVVHAHMISQILSAVLDGRPLLWVWPQPTEIAWIWIWSLVGGIVFLVVVLPIGHGTPPCASSCPDYRYCFWSFRGCLLWHFDSRGLGATGTTCDRPSCDSHSSGNLPQRPNPTITKSCLISGVIL
ncbi:CHASE2 domain-containing protein [Kovacikia minuta CCNUW1]|uniref:CHASE2 domain-containing protein n=1 Tax=Kovacikia minuta TaxID=2931930 RepID=UPI001CCADD7D|nr:CHASE2 domain-containing protein [Kovacikia minuta]UBF23750.1 CHASE2 domain-containing protein [Kovacikia minuta CCNUW1]